MKSRYVTGDFPYGLVPAAHLECQFKIDIQFVDAIIKSVLIINRTDHYLQASSLLEFVIADLKKEELINPYERDFEEIPRSNSNPR